MQPKTLQLFFFAATPSCACKHWIVSNKVRMTFCSCNKLSIIKVSDSVFVWNIPCLTFVSDEDHLPLVAHLLNFGVPTINSAFDYLRHTVIGILGNVTSCLQLNSHIRAPSKNICITFSYSCNCSPPPLSPYWSMNSAWKTCLEWTFSAPHKISMLHIKLCRTIKIDFFHLGKQIAKPEFTV